MEIERDFISELPNCVLGHIVSLLSLKDAAKTSLLCCRWRHIWTQRTQITIDNGNILGEQLKPNEILVTRADELMQSLQGKPIVYLKVAMSVDKYSSHIDKWIKMAVESRVGKIRLVLPVTTVKYEFPYQLFSTASTNLQRLHLRTCIIKAPRDFGGFGCLKILRLRHVTIGEEFVKNLMYICANLVELMLKRCDLGLHKLEIGGRRLTYLKLNSCVNTSLIVISSSSLTTFKYFGDAQRISLCEAPRLQRVVFWPTSTGFPSALRIFPTLPQLKTIVLYLSEKQVKELPENIGELRRLKTLRVYIDSHSKNLELFRISYILKASPCLQKLILVFLGTTSDERQYIVEKHGAFHHLQLKEFEMHGCVGHWSEVELAMLVLRVATNLEKIVIGHSKIIDIADGLEVLRSSTDQHRSLYESRKEWIRKILQDYIPPALKFVML